MKKIKIKSILNNSKNIEKNGFGINNSFQFKLKNSQIRTSMLFYILMAILFASILMFGYSKLVSINETISKNEVLEIQNNIKKTLESCEDPLNEGNKVFVNLGNKIKKVCFLGDTPADTQLKSIYDGGDNVVLYGNSGEILNSFKINKGVIGNSVYCSNINKKYEIGITCR